MTIPICIDVSHHQGYIDWDEVARCGVKGMIHKATEGTSFEDDMRQENCSAALDAGLGISTYHWLSPGVDPAFELINVYPCGQFRSRAVRYKWQWNLNMPTRSLQAASAHR